MNITSLLPCEGNAYITSAVGPMCQLGKQNDIINVKANTLYATITTRTFDDTEFFLRTNYVAHYTFAERELSSGRLPSSSQDTFSPIAHN